VEKLKYTLPENFKAAAADIYKQAKSLKSMTERRIMFVM
jgi:hypothetical protein